MFSVSVAVENMRAKAVGDWIDRAGVNPASIVRFYDGFRPLDLGVVTTQNLLCELALPNPCYSDVVDGVLTMKPVQGAMVLVTGDISWARVIDADGDIVGDFDVSGVNGTGDLKLPMPEATVYQGATMSLTVWGLG